jgi:hypothetical protein
MTLFVSPIGDNPSLPMSAAETYIPDQLIAGSKKLITGNITVTGNAVLSRGSVLGQVTAGSGGMAGTPDAASGNHGNGAISGITFGQQAKQGAYLISFLGATTFRVFDPSGIELSAVGSGLYGPGSGPFEIGFTFTAGTTPMVAGDEINIIAAPSTLGLYRLSKAGAVDGSQNPSVILVDQCDPTSGNVQAGGYLEGEFNGNAIIYDSSWTVAQLTALMRRWGIHIKSQVPATDPTTQTGGAMGGDAGGTLPPGTNV